MVGVLVRRRGCPVGNDLMWAVGLCPDLSDIASRPARRSVPEPKGQGEVGSYNDGAKPEVSDDGERPVFLT
jgi:hypothetical protein